MKPSIIFISISLLLTFANARHHQPVDEAENNEIRLRTLIENATKFFILNAIVSRKITTSNTKNNKDVTFYYKSRSNRGPSEFSVNNTDAINKTDIDPNRRTMFIIHGWDNDKGSPVNTKISKALLDCGGWNIFIVDWSHHAKQEYSTALSAMPWVGNITAKFIDRLMQNTGLEIQDVNLVGHSLGAHVCGIVGSTFGGKVGSIVGLDPAYPLIEKLGIHCLNWRDAKYVQVIHTNGGVLGILKPIGHADFYPNGGEKQNGCGIDALDGCSHSRSYLYFAESIHSNFYARKCDSYCKWKGSLCASNKVAKMGGNILDRVHGTYYLETKEKEPFTLGHSS